MSGLRILVLFALLATSGCHACEEAVPPPPAASDPEPTPWGNSIPVAQTVNHAFVTTGDTFYVVDLKAPRKALPLPLPSHVPPGLTAASDGTSVLVTYATSEDAGWFLVSESGWLVAPHNVAGFSPQHGSWWSPQRRAYFVSWFTRNTPANGAALAGLSGPAPTFTLHLTEISADGQNIESRSLPFEWESPTFRNVRYAWPRSICLVGDETVVVTEPGRCSLVFEDKVARCGEIQAPELVVCTNERAFLGYASAGRLTPSGLVPYPRPMLDGGKRDIFSKWYAFDETGTPRLISNQWTGAAQEFFDGARLYTTINGKGQTRIVRSRIDGGDAAEVTIDGDGYLMAFPSPARLTLFGFSHMAVVEMTRFARQD